jgi:hypothetical protein
MRMDPKLDVHRQGLTVFLPLFDDDPSVKHTFCPQTLHHPARILTRAMESNFLRWCSRRIEQHDAHRDKYETELVQN